MRCFRNVLLAIAALAIVLVAGWQLVGWVNDLRRPSLARHLPTNAQRAEKEFDRRVRARFPLGSSVAAMERALSQEGFGPAYAFKNSRYVRLDRSTGLLEESFTVLWEADGDRMTTVHGSYGLTGP